MAGMSEMKFSIVVVSWNVSALLMRCLRALEREREAGADIEVFVVDNASKDDSAAMVRQHHPWVKLTVPEKNIGFAQACNQALTQAKGDYVVLLNPDTEVAAGFFTDLEKSFLRHGKAGVIGGHILNEDGTTQTSVRSFPSRWALQLEALKILGRAPGLAKNYLMANFDYATAQQVDQVMGACFAVPRAVWKELGGFDEGFFLWFEEVDFCKRAKDNGYEVWYEPTLTILHTKGTSFKQLTKFQRHYFFTNSLLRYAKKHLGEITRNWLFWLSMPYFFVAALLDYADQRGKKSPAKEK